MAKLKYQDDFPKIAEDYARKGATDKDIARRLGINQDTFYKYLKRFPEFFEALKRGRQPVDFEVENALLKRARGFEYEETHVEFEPPEDGSKKPRKIRSIRRVKKYQPPDVAACIFWLINRRPERWRDRKHFELPPDAKLPLEIVISNGRDRPKIIRPSLKDKARGALPAPGKSSAE